MSAAIPVSSQQMRLPTAINTENPAHIAPTATINDFVSIAKKGPIANMADEPNIPRTVDALNAAVVYPQNHRVHMVEDQLSILSFRLCTSMQVLYQLNQLNSYCQATGAVGTLLGAVVHGPARH